MATVVFPTTYPIDRSTSFDHDDGFEVDFLSDGDFRTRITSPDSWVTMDCRVLARTVAEKNSLRQFLWDNRGNTVTATIDGVNYSGKILRKSKISMSGRFFNVAFTYYAKVV